MKSRKNWDKSNNRSCDGKRTFNSYREAQEWNNRLKRGSGIKHSSKRIEKLHSYKCTRCQLFHLGHAPRRRRMGGLRKSDRQSFPPLQEL